MYYAEQGKFSQGNIPNTSAPMEPSTWQLAWRSSTAVLYYLTYPIFLLVKAIWILIASISAPFVYLGQTLLDWSLAPFRFLAKFEVRPKAVSPCFGRICCRYFLFLFFLGISPKSPNIN